jgi:hypothetical protein
MLLLAALAQAELEASGLSHEKAPAEAARRMGPAEVAASPARVTLHLTPALRRRTATADRRRGWRGNRDRRRPRADRADALGSAAIANAFPAGSYTSADCRHRQAAEPTAHDCLSVMTALHASHYLDDTLACA